MRPLHDIDLARIAPQPDDLKRRSLDQMRSSYALFSYNPLREALHDVFNIAPELFGASVGTSWDVIERNISRKCKSEIALNSNLSVAKSLYEFVSANDVSGRADEFFPLPLGNGIKARYWENVVLTYSGSSFIPFIDPRRSKGLNAEARRFVLSMMHERIRAEDPDYKNVRLAIFQFGNGKQGERPLKLYTDQDIKLYTFHELEQMVASTYEMWRAICDQKAADIRKSAGGGTGPLI